jgi:hypothetical protein
MQSSLRPGVHLQVPLCVCVCVCVCVCICVHAAHLQQERDGAGRPHGFRKCSDTIQVRLNPAVVFMGKTLHLCVSVSLSLTALPNKVVVSLMHGPMTSALGWEATPRGDVDSLYTDFFLSTLYYRTFHTQERE